MQRVSTMMGGSGREGECPPRLRDLLWELQVVEDALREVYENDPLDFLAEGDERPELEAWCEAEGLELDRLVVLLHRELAPLHPGFAGRELPVVSAAHLEDLGSCLAGVCPAKLEIITPHVVGLLVRGLPTPEDDHDLWPEQRLISLGERHPGIAAFLHGYDQGLRGLPARATNFEQSMLQRLKRHLLAFRVRRIVGHAVEPLLSMHLRTRAATLDTELLGELGLLLLERGQVVKNQDELDRFVEQARERLGREPEEPPSPPSSGLDEALEDVEQEAHRMGERLEPHGKKVTVVVEDREPGEPAASVVRLDRPTPAPASSASPAPVPPALPQPCCDCHHAARLRFSLGRLHATMKHVLARLRNRDGPCAVPL